MSFDLKGGNLKKKLIITLASKKTQSKYTYAWQLSTYKREDKKLVTKEGVISQHKKCFIGMGSSERREGITEVWELGPPAST